MKRTIKGLALVSKGDRSWETEDGRFRVEYAEQGLTFCDNPHPMRGGYCPGGEEHAYYGWHVWDNEGAKGLGEYTYDIRNVATFTEAAGMLADELAKESVSHP